MPTYTVIGFEKDGFDSFSSVTSADTPSDAARLAIDDVFIKRKGRPAPQTNALAELESKTGLFVVGIIEGKHENLDDEVNHYEQW
jgi:hypothetical protein